MWSSPKSRAAVAMAVMAMVTNYDHLLSLGVWKMANALWNYFSDTCAFCPMERQRRCYEDCRKGLREWLHEPYIPSSRVWKENRKK